MDFITYALLKKKIQELETSIGDKKVTFNIVDTLPLTGESSVIYLVPQSELIEQNFYFEYIYVNGNWELIGTTQIDMSGVAKKKDVEITPADIDEIWSQSILDDDEVKF